ncbi:MAG TPA: Crp/Fnr family transcriptional regulator [Chloroflexaceae bacterium]|nr:Crp/Fnr family transcriptional regulator [Chloroflexaceae bacterium]
MSTDQPNSKSGVEAALRAAPLFAALDPAILHALAAAAVHTSYGAQQVVFLMGERDDGLYVVETGWLKAVKSAANGREQTFATFGPGAALNDVAVLAGAPTQASVIALEPTTLWRIPGERLLALVEQYPTLARALIGSLAARVIYLAGLVEDLALRPVEARLARLILTQARDGQVERRSWATQAELAAQVGTVPDVLNRALRTLADDGLIAVDRRSIRVLDQAGLEARAQLE